MNEDIKYNVDTYFAPAERLDNDDVYLQTIKILGLRPTISILNILPNIIVILNSQRQIVYTNESFNKLIGLTEFELGLGLRPGELLECIHSHDHINGCGTGKECMYCGLVLTILKSQRTATKQEAKANIIVSKNGKNQPLDYHVIVSPIIIDNEIFYVLIVSDICNQNLNKA
ncbi:MAG: PAS domain-containing protein [Candidatus Heimdallarchaeota archaeon]|nr:PAS domain-containing protein [Candidatus Heimdallarchaeota archaeon]